MKATPPPIPIAQDKINPIKLLSESNGIQPIAVSIELLLHKATLELEPPPAPGVAVGAEVGILGTGGGEAEGCGGTTQ